MHFETVDDFLIAHDVETSGTKRNVVVEKSALPPYAHDHQLLSDWIVKHSAGAVQNNDMGDRRYPDIYSAGQCGWIYRVLHNNGDVSIKKAPGNA